MKSKWVTECTWRFDGYAVASDKTRYMKDHPIRMTREEFADALFDQYEWVPPEQHATGSLALLSDEMGADASMWGWPVVFVEGTT